MPRGSAGPEPATIVSRIARLTASPTKVAATVRSGISSGGSTTFLTRYRLLRRVAQPPLSASDRPMKEL